MTGVSSIGGRSCEGANKGDTWGKVVSVVRRTKPIRRTRRHEGDRGARLRAGARGEEGRLEGCEIPAGGSVSCSLPYQKRSGGVVGGVWIKPGE